MEARFPPPQRYKRFQDVDVTDTGVWRQRCSNYQNTGLSELSHPVDGRREFQSFAWVFFFLKKVVSVKFVWNKQTRSDISDIASLDVATDYCDIWNMHTFWNVRLHVSGGGFQYKHRKLCLYPALLPVQMLSFHRCRETQRTSQGIKTKLAPVHELGSQPRWVCCRDVVWEVDEVFPGWRVPLFDAAGIAAFTPMWW